MFSIFEKLFKDKFSQSIEKYLSLPVSGSKRIYYRLFSKNTTAIGVYSPINKVTDSFLSFTKTFYKEGLNVPEIYCVDKENKIYIISDLGDQSLISIVQKQGFTEEIEKIYKLVLKELIKFQIIGKEKIDYNFCYPIKTFKKKAFLWDLNYFKYCFLILLGIDFDELKLEEDFQKLSDYLNNTMEDFFLYRDFQARNILIKDNKPYFIDYQGGRKGSVFYDVSSLLYQARAKIPENIREKLFSFYFNSINQEINLKDNEIKYYKPFVVLRILQTLGTYGYRGFYQKKNFFTESINLSVSNICNIINNKEFPLDLPVIKKIINSLFNKKINILNK